LKRRDDGATGTFSAYKPTLGAQSGAQSSARRGFQSSKRGVCYAYNSSKDVHSRRIVAVTSIRSRIEHCVRMVDKRRHPVFKRMLRGQRLSHDGVFVEEKPLVRADHCEGVVPASPVGADFEVRQIDPFLRSTPVSLRLSVWEEELYGDKDRIFVLNGIQYGFSIVDRPCELRDVYRRNYRSCLLENRELVEAQIAKEVSLGRYVITDIRPSVISSLGAIPKSSTAIRLIHDLSRPEGGINKFGVDSAVVYSCLDDALKLIKTGSFLAKIDLKEAYRSIPIHPSCYEWTGLQWTFAGEMRPTFFV
jgi:hypothetical protein